MDNSPKQTSYLPALPGTWLKMRKGEVLFMFRRGKWDLPKGKLDPGETLEACALREVEEETGVGQLELKNFLLVTEHTYAERGTGYV